MTETLRIRVTYDADGDKLTIDPDYLRLPHDAPAIHSVVWDFVGVDRKVAEGWLPHLEFLPLHPGGLTPYSGPFLTLCRTALAIGTRIVSCGLNGVPGEYRYRAVLEAPPHLESICSREARIESEIFEPRPKEIQVRRSPDDPNMLEVRPQDVSLIAGQPLEWRIEENLVLADRWYPRLLFSPSPYQPYHPYLGPFTSLDVTQKSIVATGSGHQPGKYKYRFQLISWEDGTVKLESSPDPIIDDEGDPPTDG